MKIVIEILRKAALLGFFVAFMACSSDDGQDVTGSGGEFSAKVGGVGIISEPKDFDTVSWTKIVAGGSTIVSLMATDKSGRGFMLRLATYT